MRKVVHALILFGASGAGSGYSPWAPGTVGSVVGVAIFLVAGLALRTPDGGLTALALGVSWLGIWLAGRAEAIWGTRDDPRITIDEVAGMLVSLVYVPAPTGSWGSLQVAVAGFLLFRLFDIWKPVPVRSVEALRGGFGVMADDLVAGLYANLGGQILWRWLLPAGVVPGGVGGGLG